jgi:DNA-binding MarR family transcriptional regulator
VLEFMRSLWAVNHALESVSWRMNKRFGVTGPERMVLRLVGRYPGIPAGVLARILHVHPSTLTALLKRLVRRGVLVRRADRQDARKALFTLTEKGVAVDRLKRGTVEAGIQGALEAVAERDVRKTAAVLDEIARALGE